MRFPLRKFKFFRNKIVFFQLFLSYLVMLGLVILLSVGMYFHAYNIISRQSEEVTLALLDKMQTEIDGHFGSARQNLAELLLDSDVQRAAKTKGGFSIGDRELLYSIHSDIAKKCISNSDFSHLMIYFKEGGTVLTEKGHMESSLFYELYYEQPDLSREAVLEVLEGSWYGEDIAVRNRMGEQELWILQNSIARGEEDSAILGVGISEATLKMWMTNLLWNESLELMMIHPDGVFIGNETLAEGLRHMNYTVTKEGISPENRIVDELEIAGEEYGIYAVPSKETQFYYVVLMPLGSIEQGAGSILLFMVIGLGVCVVLGIVIAYILTGIHYNPLRHVMDVFGSYGKDGKQENRNELEWLLDKSRDMLEFNREIKSRYYNNTQILRSQYLYRLITLPYEGKSVYAEEFAADAAFQGPDHLVVLFFMEGEGEAWVQTDTGLYQFILSNVLKELVQEKYGAELVELQDAIACVINGKNQGEETREELEGFFDALQTFVEERLGRQLFVAGGCFKQGFEGIYESYCAAREASEYREQLKGWRVVWYEDIRNRQTYYEYKMEEEQKIVNGMKAGEEENVCQWIDNVIDANFKGREIVSGMKKCLLFELVGTIMKGIGQEEAEELIPRLSFEHRISTGLSAEEAKEYFHQMIHEICVCAQKRKQAAKEDKQFGCQVMKYVQEHYQDPDLNISITALHFKITPSYLSALFKEQTGESLLEYINHTRVEKVRELLEEGKSVVEICPLTGFRNSGALIRVFKKETGITPGQMKKIKK